MTARRTRASLASLALVTMVTADAFSEPSPSDDESLELMRAIESDSEGGASNEAPSGAARTLQSMNPDISLILDAAASWFSADDPKQTGAHDPNRTGFTLQQLELFIASAVDPYFRMQASLVFSQFGVEVEEAFGASQALPGGLQVRAGQMLTRFGRLNATHPHAWHFVDQPLVNGKFFGGESSRGLGLELSWLAPTPWYLEIVTSATDAAGACCARSFFGADDLGVRGPEDLLYTLALKQFYELSQDWSLAWGLSTQLGPNSSGWGNRTEIYGTDIYLRYRPLASTRRTSLSLQVEAMLRARQVPFDALRDFGTYAQLVWAINRRWEVGARLDVVSGIDEDPLDPDWTSTRDRTSLQATFYPSHFSRIRLQGKADRSDDHPSTIWGAMLSVEFVIGAHGAHAY